MSTPSESALSAPTIHHTDSETNAAELRARSASNPEDPPWGLLGASLVWVASVLLSLFLPSLIAFPYIASHYPGGHLTNETLFADKTLVIIFISGLFPVHLLTLILAWAVVTRLGKLSAVRTLGFRWPANFGIAKSVGVASLLLIMSMFLLYKFGGQETDFERMLQSSRAAALILSFIAVATAPLVEEVLYRGLLYSAFQRVTGPLFAVVIVASIFAGLHVVQYWPNAAAISAITLLSVVLTIVRARTGRLLPCFVIHLVFNGIQSLIIVFDPYLRALLESWQHHAAAPGLVNFLLGFPL